MVEEGPNPQQPLDQGSASNTTHNSPVPSNASGEDGASENESDSDSGAGSETASHKPLHLSDHPSTNPFADSDYEDHLESSNCNNNHGRRSISPEHAAATAMAIFSSQQSSHKSLFESSRSLHSHGLPDADEGLRKAKGGKTKTSRKDTFWKRRKRKQLKEQSGKDEREATATSLSRRASFRSRKRSVSALVATILSTLATILLLYVLLDCRFWTVDVGFVPGNAHPLPLNMGSVADEISGSEISQADTVGAGDAIEDAMRDRPTETMQDSDASSAAGSAEANENDTELPPSMEIGSTSEPEVDRPVDRPVDGDAGLPPGLGAGSSNSDAERPFFYEPAPTAADNSGGGALQDGGEGASRRILYFRRRRGRLRGRGRSQSRTGEHWQSQDRQTQEELTDGSGGTAFNLGIFSVQGSNGKCMRIGSDPYRALGFGSTLAKIADTNITSAVPSDAYYTLTQLGVMQSSDGITVPNDTAYTMTRICAVLTIIFSALTSLWGWYILRSKRKRICCKIDPFLPLLYLTILTLVVGVFQFGSMAAVRACSDEIWLDERMLDRPEEEGGGMLYLRQARSCTLGGAGIVAIVVLVLHALSLLITYLGWLRRAKRARKRREQDEWDAWLGGAGAGIAAGAAAGVAAATSDDREMFSEDAYASLVASNDNDGGPNHGRNPFEDDSTTSHNDEEKRKVSPVEPVVRNDSDHDCQIKSSVVRRESHSSVLSEQSLQRYAVDDSIPSFNRAAPSIVSSSSSSDSDSSDSRNSEGSRSASHPGLLEAVAPGASAAPSTLIRTVSPDSNLENTVAPIEVAGGASGTPIQSQERSASAQAGDTSTPFASSAPINRATALQTVREDKSFHSRRTGMTSNDNECDLQSEQQITESTDHRGNLSRDKLRPPDRPDETLSLSDIPMTITTVSEDVFEASDRHLYTIDRPANSRDIHGQGEPGRQLQRQRSSGLVIPNADFNNDDTQGDYCAVPTSALPTARNDTITRLRTAEERKEATLNGGDDATQVSEITGFTSFTGACTSIATSTTGPGRSVVLTESPSTLHEVTEPQINAPTSERPAEKPSATASKSTGTSSAGTSAASNAKERIEERRTSLAAARRDARSRRSVSSFAD